MELNECRVTKPNGGVSRLTKATLQCSTIKAEVSSEMDGKRMELRRKLTFVIEMALSDYEFVSLDVLKRYVRELGLVAWKNIDFLRINIISTLP